jgi:hypothetical protein
MRKRGPPSHPFAEVMKVSTETRVTTRAQGRQRELDDKLTRKEYLTRMELIQPREATHRDGL